MKIGVLFLSISLSFAGRAQQTSIPTVSRVSTQVMNYTDVQQVLQLKKLEIGAELPLDVQTKVNNFIYRLQSEKSQLLNPFLEWEIDLEFSFTNTTTGKTEEVDAFYYVEYERNTKKNDWIEKNTKFPFRVRYCPKETGEYTYVATLKVNGKEIAKSMPGEFSVINSEAHGFVKIHQNNRNLELDNRLIYPLGHNFISPYNGVDIYAPKPNETNKAARVDDWMNYHNDIQKYHELGGTYFRFVQSAWSSLIEFEEKGNYYNRLHYAWEQDRLLDYCDSNNMLINMNFMFQEPLMNYGQYNTTAWDFSHYDLQSDGTYKYNLNDPYKAFCYNNRMGKEPHEMYTEEEDLKYHEQRIRYYVSRYGYSSSIMIYEFLSEPFHLDQYYPGSSFEMRDDEKGKQVREALKNYNLRMASYIKDTMNQRDHLIGIHAYDNKIFWDDPVAQTILDEGAKLPMIDIVGYSTYKSEAQRLVIKKTTRGTGVDADENSYYQKMTEFWASYGKPVMHFEQGSPADILSRNDVSNFVPHEIDVRTVGYTGALGFYAWEGFFKEKNRDQSIAWPSTVLAEKWMNSDFLVNVLSNGQGQWIQGRQAERHSRKVSQATKETEYFIAQDLKSASGFVLNRTYNEYTMCLTEDDRQKITGKGESYMTLTNITWDEGRKPLYVSSLLPKAEYKIVWYDWSNLGEISSQVIRTSRKGELRLEFPELTLIPGNLMRPMVWYNISLVE